MRIHRGGSAEGLALASQSSGDSGLDESQQWPRAGGRNMGGAQR